MLLKEVERWVFGGADRPGIEKCFRRMTGIPSVNERMRFHPKICKMILKDVVVGMTMRILNMITFISLSLCLSLSYSHSTTKNAMQSVGATEMKEGAPETYPLSLL